jgi:cell pole-organizing protein PopZ
LSACLRIIDTKENKKNQEFCVNDLTQERLKKPLSDDMSMDEILASIRKIISSDSNVYDNNSESEVSRSRVAETSHNPRTLSAREQLLSLTTRSHHADIHSDIDELYNHKTPPSSVKKPSTVPAPDNLDVGLDVGHQRQMKDNRTTIPSSQHKASYEKLASYEDKPFQSHQHDQNDENTADADILRTLNQIRQSLSVDNLSLEKSSDSSYLAQKNDDLSASQPKKKDLQTPSAFVSQGNVPVKMTAKEVHPVIKNPEIIHDVDLRPAQFSLDTVPDFLKKFKNQQLEERTAPTSIDSLSYDISSLPKFDEDNDVLSLTDKVMPNASVNKNLKKEGNLSNTVSKLRAGTEEIMRRATERCLLGDDVDETLNNNNDDVDNDSLFASLIMKTIKPMIKEWIDVNMEEIVKQVLHQELRRGLK